MKSLANFALGLGVSWYESNALICRRRAKAAGSATIHDPPAGSAGLPFDACPRLQDAQDLLQEVFLIISRKADTWSDGTNFLAWACAIARYEALHLARSNQRVIVPLDADVLEMLQAEPPAVDHLEQQIERLKECLQRLSPRSRELVMLRYHASQMPEAIAGSLNWSVGAVRVALTRAKQALRECIKERLVAGDLS